MDDIKFLKKQVVLDIKEVSKRTVQLVQISLITCFSIMVLNLILGVYLTASILAVWCVFYTIILYVVRKNFYKGVKILIAVAVNLLLTIATVAEGLDSGAYLFFLPLLFALPFMLEDSSTFKRELYFHLVFTFMCFLVALLISDEQSSWQVIPHHISQIKFFINSISAVFLSGLFSYFSIMFERKYASALVEQRKKAEEASKARSIFLSNMGHELRTPLNGIIGAANLLDKGLPLYEQDQYLNIVRYCSDHMLQLVNDILDFNKIEAGKIDLHPIEFNLNHLLRNSILPFHNRFEQKGVELITNWDDEVNKIVFADDLRIIQILNNLISNALKFTEQGYVKLEAKVSDKTASSMRVNFIVEDTGIGIAPEDQKKIFESFEQVYTETSRKYNGTGLGLSIGLRLLSLMGSKLEVESAIGKGSKFYFSILFDIISDAKVSTNLKVEHTSIAGKKVLIAEDNLINMLIAKKMLQGWNVELTTAVNGIEAVAAVTATSGFDLILLDLGMPEMDGYDAVKAIKKISPQTPVLAFTAALMDNEMQQFLLSIGFTDSILKPFKPEELLTKIRDYAL